MAVDRWTACPVQIVHMNRVESWNFIEQWARDHGIKPDALRKWREQDRRVPYRYRMDIRDDAQKAGQELDTGVFDQPPPSSQVEAA